MGLFHSIGYHLAETRTIPDIAMDFPAKFPDETEAILDEVARFRARSPDEHDPIAPIASDNSRGFWRLGRRDTDSRETWEHHRIRPWVSQSHFVRRKLLNARS